MNKLKEFKKLTNQESFEELLKQGVKNAFGFINQNYISKEEMLGLEELKLEDVLSEKSKYYGNTPTDKLVRNLLRNKIKEKIKKL